MSSYADTSLLLSLYRAQSSSGVANRLVRGLTAALPLTPLLFLELRNGLTLAQFRGEVDVRTRDAAWAHVLQDVEHGVLTHVLPPTAAVYGKAAELSDRHGATLGTRTLDVLHVAAALVLECDRFLSFDHRQCALARAVSLRVSP